MLDGGKPSYASDVYSLGVVMWEILTRGTPWGSESRPREIMSRVLNGDTLVIPEDCPVSLADLLRACWSRDQEKRPSAEEVLERIRSPD